MKSALKILCAAFAIILSGCAAAPKNPIAIDQSFWNTEGKRIGIVMTTTPENDVYLPGAGCLLCIAAAETANSSLSSHVETLTYDELDTLKSDAAAALQKKGFTVEIIEKPINLAGMKKLKPKDTQSAEYDFSYFTKQKQLTHLVLFDIRMVGMTRSYANYFPTSDPAGYFSGFAYLIDLQTNSYVWYLPVDVRMSSEDKNWDEPGYPALTNAYYQAIATGKDQMLTPLAK